MPASASLPHFEKRGQVTQFIVDGKPFLVLGGKLGNNTATNLEHMQQIWPALAAMHLNTVLAPVSWALLEPQEGQFDFTLVDGLIRDAAQHNLHLVFLWFGGLATVEEGTFIDGQWHRELTLAGDATAQGLEVRFQPGRPMIQRVLLYRYK